MAFISEVESIFIQRIYTGWISLRNQTCTPVKMMGRRVIELYDALISGNDFEITPLLSLKRRAGHTLYTQALGSTLLFYSWKSNTQGTIPILDTTTSVEYVSGTPPVATSFYAKGVSTQSSIIGIGNYLYIGTSPNVKWDGPSGAQGITNWGISPNSAAGPGNSGSQGPQLAGAGANVAQGSPPSTYAWTNPGNVSNTATSYATATISTPVFFSLTQLLNATNFGFTLPNPLPGAIVGILVTLNAGITAYSGNPNSQATVYANLTYNGANIGTSFNILQGSTTIPTGPYSVGGISNNWNAGLTAAQVNSSGFGVGISANLVVDGGVTTTVSFAVNDVTITIYYAPQSSATPTGTGTFSAVNGYTYATAYGNTVSGEISNASALSANTGPFTNKASVNVQIPASTDPQVNQIRVYRTTDSGGGNQLFEIPSSPYPNIGWVFTSVAAASGSSTTYTGTPTGGAGYASSVGQFFTVAGFVNAGNNGPFPATAATPTTLTLTNSGGVAETAAATGLLTAEDSAPDTSLQVTSQAELNLGNTPPPPGLTNLAWWSGRMWGSVNNLLYASTGPETLAGTAPNSNWNPQFQYVIPGTITRLVPAPNGMIIFTLDDSYIVRGTDITNYTINEYVKDLGLRTYNALDTDGSSIYMMTSDRQFLVLSAAGETDLGVTGGIADQLATVDPTQCYVAMNRYGLDSIVRILDTVNNVYYDYNVNQQCWNLPGILQVPACAAMGSIEVTPGVWRLILSFATTSMVSTTSTSAVTATGTQTIQLANPAGFVVGETVTVDTGINAENVIVANLIFFRIGGRKFLVGFSAVFAKTHLAGVTVSASVAVSNLGYRDITNFQDLGVNYAPNAVFGSIQLADPGSLAKFGALAGFSMQYTEAGTAPALSVLLNDIGCVLSNPVGSQITTAKFTSLNTPKNGFSIPPTLGNQPTGYRNLGYYLSGATQRISGFAQNLQFLLAAPAENTALELIGFGIYGDLKQEVGTAGQLPQIQGR
jgi:hypothetical protein